MTIGATKTQFRVVLTNLAFLWLYILPLPTGLWAAEPVKATWWGHSMFAIESASGLKIVCDPYGLHLGAYDDPNLRGDLVLVSHNHSDHANVDLVKGDPIVLRGLKYGVVQPIRAMFDRPENTLKPRLSFIDSGTKHALPKHAIGIQTIASYHDKQQGKIKGNNAMFLAEVEGLRFLHTGDIGQSKLSQVQIEQSGRVDALIIPVGGNSTVNAEEAIAITRQLNPRYVFPVHYAVRGLRLRLMSKHKFVATLISTPSVRGLPKP